MRECLVLVLVCAWAIPLRAELPAPIERSQRTPVPADAARLDALFPPPPDRRWDVLREAPEAPSHAEEGALGLWASVARHYTLGRGPVSEVCTIEFWAFERPDQAEAALAALERPSWWGKTAGSLLVLAHGVRLERRARTRHGLVEGCEALAEAAHARALASLPELPRP